MTAYIISLPRELPASLFENLGGEGANDAIMSRLSGDYSKVSKIEVTTARSSGEAIRNLLFRELRDRDNAAALARMFGCVSARYAFELPEREVHDLDGNIHSEKTSDIAQKMKLACEIARVRESRPEDCYGEATDALNFIHSR